MDFLSRRAGYLWVWLRRLHNEHGAWGAAVLCAAIVAGIWSTVATQSQLTSYLSDLLPVGFAALATTCALLAARSCHDVRVARAWRFVTAAMLFRMVGDGIWAWLELVEHTSPFPSLADVGYIAFYPAVLAAFWTLPASHRSASELLRLGLDAATLIVAGTVAVWYFMLAPTIDSATSLSATVVLDVAYPVGDLLLVFAVGSSIIRRSDRVPLRPMQWLVAATSCLLIGDVVFTQQSLHESYNGIGVPDSFWTLGLAAFAVAALVQLREVHKQATFSERQADASSLGRVSIAPYVGAAISCALLLIVVHRAALYPTLGVVLGAITITTLVVARQLAAMADNRRLLAAYRRLATTDPLTGLATRGHLIDVATLSFNDSPQLSVLMIDIDHFKTINDRHGHHVGDAALRHVARLCELNTRDSDAISGRYGGDEIVIVLFGADAHAATKVAERLGTAANSHRLSLAEGDIELTLSIGVAERQNGIGDFASLLQRADQALYAAKQQGRNRVHCASALHS